MTVVGIETATDVCSVGVLAGETVVERSVRESRIHSEKLLVMLREALDEAGLAWKDVQGVALSSGPGSFTGLRIGASTAKGLLSAQMKPFVLVPTFAGVMENCRRAAGPGTGLVVCLDAKQDEWYVQETENDGTVSELRVMRTADLAGLIGGRPVVTDVPDRFKEYSSVSDLRKWCSGAAIARLGRARLQKGESDDVRLFEPSYWKEFVVRTTPKAVTPPRDAKER